MQTLGWWLANEPAKTESFQAVNWPFKDPIVNLNLN
ncbi:hypothetical protein ROSI111154_10850 [Rouxiella silvae]